MNHLGRVLVNADAVVTSWKTARAKVEATPALLKDCKLFSDFATKVLDLMSAVRVTVAVLVLVMVAVKGGRRTRHT